MPNPKRKHTRSRRDSRRSANWKLDAVSASVCQNPECGKKRPPHVVCPHCGWYNGRVVVTPKAKSEQGPEQQQGK